MPGAVWIGPTVNENPGAEGTVYGLVLHIQQGTEAGTESWERDPASQVSSHFLTPKSGGLRQMVDTADKAWCEVAGNTHWISIECEGMSGEALTDAQVTACAQLLAWLHEAYAVPLAPASNPNAATVAQGGLGYHSMGGAAWGGHYDCPGLPIIAQRALICARAASIVDGNIPMEDEMQLLVRESDKPHVWFGNGVNRRWIGSEAELGVLQRALSSAGLSSTVRVWAPGEAQALGVPVGALPPAP